MSVIELKNISKLYGFGEVITTALDKVDLTIEKGEFVAIMGPSGSGKSTLLNTLGLLDRPSGGTYKLSGKPVDQLGQAERAKVRREQIGFIFQSFNLLPRMSVIENVALPLTYKGVPHVKRLEMASKILKSMDMQHREYYYPAQLSGGQLQRVAIARALVNKPSLILADEPTGNLDTKSGENIMSILKKLNKDGNTIVMVTHDTYYASYAKRLIHVVDGKITDTAKPKKTRAKKSATTKAKTTAKRKSTKKKAGKK